MFTVRSKIRSRHVLFLTSMSVILITLGIIQTLLFEAISFFSEIADVRGWFSFQFSWTGLFSQTGLAGCIFAIACALEWVSLYRPEHLGTAPEAVLFPPSPLLKVVYFFAIFSFLYLDSFLLYMSVLVFVFEWRNLAKSSKLHIKDTERRDDRSMLNALGVLALISFFFATTSHYGGAFGEFFFQTEWTPTGACADRRTLCENMSFGVNGLLLTTLQVAFGALFIAVPLGVGCAIYLSEYASPRLVAVVKPTLEILAGIPSVVYGFFAFIYIGPLVVSVGEVAYSNGWIDQPPNILNPINGALVVGIMILPLVASMSEDALRAVPNELREGSLALGATRIETTLRVMVQAALSGILASIILALSRAVGETMAVTLAVGTAAVYTANMFLPAQTMTAYIAQRVGGDLPFGEIGYLTIFAVGLYLFIITLCLNLLGNKILSAYREAY
jgi:phosphate transport system permease protein